MINQEIQQTIGSKSGFHIVVVDGLNGQGLCLTISSRVFVKVMTRNGNAMLTWRVHVGTAYMHYLEMRQCVAKANDIADMLSYQLPFVRPYFSR